jgi:hypothetical protein
MRIAPSRLGRRTRWTRDLAGVIALAVLLSFRSMSRCAGPRQMNACLTGYSVSIGKLRFHPIGLSLTLFDLAFTQQANPEPWSSYPRLDASVHWRALLSGKLCRFARSPEALRQPRAPAGGGRRSRARRQARLAGGVPGDLPPQDQSVQDPKRGGHVRG